MVVLEKQWMVLKNKRMKTFIFLISIFLITKTSNSQIRIFNQEPPPEPVKTIVIDSSTKKTENISINKDSILQKDTTIDYYVLGRKDAVVYYKSTGAFVVGALCGIYLFPGIIVAPISALSPVKARHLDNVKNPNDSLLTTNADYLNGYKTQVKKEKIRTTGRGFAIGALFTGCIVLYEIRLLNKKKSN